MNSDKKAAINWARQILANSEQYYILDTETTGLSDPEVIELSILDLDGNMIVNQRFLPTKHIEHGASQIHGMTNQTLANCPKWDGTAKRLEKILKERKLLIYNFEHDNNAIVNTYSNHGLRPPLLHGYCVMDWYSKFVGDWNNYRKNYRWQKLPGGDHSALGDCMATLEVIKGMAATDSVKISELVIDEVFEVPF